MNKRLNLSYGAIQGTYWMYFGAIISFASVYLLGMNYTNTEIGVIIAAGGILAVILQPLLADAADRSRRVSLAQINGMIVLGLILGTASLFFFASKALALSVIFIMIGAWHTSQQPLINSMAFHLSENGHQINFGAARGGGSVAYAVLTAILGSLVAVFGINAVPAAGIILLILLLASLAVTEKFYKSAVTVRLDETVQKETVQDAEPIGLRAFAARNGAFLVLTVGIILVFFQSAVINIYLMQIITAVGGTSDQMGRLFSFMALLELPGLIFFSRLRQRFSCQLMLKIASVAFVLKILLTYTAPSVAFIYLAFIFQAVSFPIFLSASVYLVDEVMEKGEAVKGQSLITGTMTLSNVFASLAGGVILDASGASLLLLISTALTALGAVIVFITVGRIKPKMKRL